MEFTTLRTLVAANSERGGNTDVTDCTDFRGFIFGKVNL
mgnify:CR=1 FL=1